MRPSLLRHVPSPFQPRSTFRNGIGPPWIVTIPQNHSGIRISRHFSLTRLATISMYGFHDLSPNEGTSTLPQLPDRAWTGTRDHGISLDNVSNLVTGELPSDGPLDHWATSCSPGRSTNDVSRRELGSPPPFLAPVDYVRINRLFKPWRNEPIKVPP